MDGQPAKPYLPTVMCASIWEDSDIAGPAPGCSRWARAGWSISLTGSPSGWPDGRGPDRTGFSALLVGGALGRPL